MPTYIYETLRPDGDGQGERFEVRQSIGDPPLTRHPETGLPVRRVISGGLGLLTRPETSLPEPGPGCGPGTCGCGRFS